MRYIGDPFQVVSTRAGALPARPCHFRVMRRTYDARAGRSSLSGVSASSCARRDVVALVSHSSSVRFLLDSSLGLEALRAGQEHCGNFRSRVRVPSRAPVHTLLS